MTVKILDFAFCPLNLNDKVFERLTCCARFFISVSKDAVGAAKLRCAHKNALCSAVNTSRQIKERAMKDFNGKAAVFTEV